MTEQVDMFGHAIPVSAPPVMPPKLTKKIRQAHVAANGSGFGSLKAMESSRRDAALALAIDDATLRAWYVIQVEWTREKAERLAAVADENGRKLEERDASPALWLERFWGPMARLQYVLETQRLLAERLHVLVCPNHGIDGVYDAPPGLDYAALADRGMVEAGTGSWHRYCLACSKAQTNALAGRMSRGLVTEKPELVEMEI